MKNPKNLYFSVTLNKATKYCAYTSEGIKFLLKNSYSAIQHVLIKKTRQNTI